MISRLFSVLALAACVVLPIAGASAGEDSAAVIVCPAEASHLERLAAKEIRRYVYLRSGGLLPIVEALPESGDAIIVASSGRPDVSKWAVGAMDPEETCLKTLSEAGRSVTLVLGGSDVATLYAAYRFAELLGIRFYLHGDVVPDDRTEFGMPKLDERRKPLFALRGIQPFHDFAEGPDWWNPDDYKAIIRQLPKLGMNFIGLHTYPEERPAAEPTVWIGLPEDINADGTVRFAYPAIYYNTLLNVAWGYAAKATGDYCLGAGAMYDRDDYGSEIMRGLGPMPQSPEDCNQVFDRAGTMLRDGFSLAHRLGIKTCVGTETPLVVPKRVRERVGSAPDIEKIYEGIFTRIVRAYPIDYYWFWTPENWTWENVKQEAVDATIEDIKTALRAAKSVGAPFQLATCGWVLGPQNDRALFDKVLPKEMPLSCISRQVGMDPVDGGFADVSGRPKWAIPWLEDDPALNSTQLWAGRMRRDAADALSLGCTGLMGIHWRTRILGPNMSALAQAAWDQRAWAKPKTNAGGVIGGQVADFSNTDFAETEDDTLYQTVRYDMSAYRIPVPNGAFRVTLEFCEPYYKEKSKRVFGVKLEGKPVVEHLDVFARVGANHAYDMTFNDINVTDGMLDIDFVKEVEFPCVAAIDVEGQDVSRKINCGGPAYKDYAEDMPSLSEFQPVGDFYRDWASVQFGPQVAEASAAIFEKIDCHLPRTSNWIGGPGGYQPEKRPWETVRKEYGFVDELAALRPNVTGKGSLERFDYWLSNFAYMKAMARACCVWWQFDKTMEQVKAADTPEKKKQAARDIALPARKELVAAVSEAYQHLLNTVNTSGEMGSVTNLEQHTLPGMIEKPGQELAAALGEPLPPDAVLPREYAGSARVFVPTVRDCLDAGESLTVKVVVLAKETPPSGKLLWRTMGEGQFAAVPLEHVTRGVYTATIEKPTKDIEYYIEIIQEKGQAVRWPATAPEMNQSVIIAPAA
jgi:hypothetical protein